MRTLLLASAAMLCLSGGAFAQNSTGSPMSGRASNITSGDTRSSIAPRLPLPGAGEDPDQLLRTAQSALARGRTGQAQEALERAETRLLDRSTAPSAAGTPISDPRIDAIRQALTNLGTGDRAGAKSAISMAMNQPGTGAPAGSGAMGSGAMGNGMMGNGSMGAMTPPSGMAPAAAGPGVNPTTIQPAGGPQIAPASGPGSASPVNPAGQTGGTGNQGSP